MLARPSAPPQPGRVRRPRRLAALLTSGAILAATFYGADAASAAPPYVPPKPPPVPAAPGNAPVNPPDSQIQSASAQKDAVAAQVGQLSAQVSQAETQLQQLRARYELAEQRVALARSKYEEAQVKADASKAALDRATASVGEARLKFARYMQATYMSGDPSGIAGSLLTADDPTALLDQSSMNQYQADHDLDAVGGLQRASVTKSNAATAAKKAEADAKAAKRAADHAQQLAHTAYENQQTQTASLREQQAQTQVKLTAAQGELATLNGQRDQFNAWHAKQVAYDQSVAAHQRYTTAVAKRVAYNEHQAYLAHQAFLRDQARRAAAKHHHGHGGGGNGGGGGSGNGGDSNDYTPLPSYSPPAPSGGSWSKAKAAQAVARAKSTLGMPYAWAGGGKNGPSYGVCDGGSGAPNDCHVYGYDCSGLVMFAWHQGWDHFAATQYSEAGSYHPSPGNFKPGDLLFWSADGSRGGIEHVAIYIGHGDVIQAPQSNDIVRITPWQQVMWGYYGATRPMT